MSSMNFWRTLDELADDPAFRERLYNEFPSQIDAIADPVARRTFLKLMGASLALAGVTACTRQPEEKIVPYVRQPEEIIPGKPLFYATAMTVGGSATGHPRRKPRRASNEDRRQHGSSVEPRRRRRVRAGLGPRPVRSRPLAHGRSTSAKSVHGRPS